MKVLNFDLTNIAVLIAKLNTHFLDTIHTMVTTLHIICNWN